MKTNKITSIVCVILILSLALAGCAKPAEGPEAKPVRDTLIVAHSADAVTLDPHNTNDQPSARVMKQIYQTLVTQNLNMEIEPELAESWTFIDDKTVEFKLKKGVKFHNGEPFTARDVAFSLKRSASSSHVGHITGAIDTDKIEIIDDYTIRITTKYPFAPLLAHLAHNGASIVNEKTVLAMGDDYGRNPVGTGPYQFVEWITGDRIILKAFDDFHGEKPKIPNLVMRGIVEQTVRTIELEAGSVDIIYDVLASDQPRIENNPNLILLKDPSFTNGYIGFNCQKPPFDDVRVRQAINYALDIDTLIEAVFFGTAVPAAGPIGSNVWASNQSLKPYGFDIEKAKKLLADAGYPNGFKTTLWTNDRKERLDIAQIVQDQLKRVGIDVTIEVLEWGKYLSDTADGKHDMFILGWVTVTGDPDYGLYPLFHSSLHGTGGNRTFYTNPKVDELLDKGRTSTDPNVRMKAYIEAQEIIREDAPWIFTHFVSNTAGLQKYVKGFNQHPAGHHRLWTVYFEE